MKAIEELRTRIETLTRDLTRYGDDITTLTSLLSSAHREIEALTNELSTAVPQLDAARTDCATCQHRLAIHTGPRRYFRIEDGTTSWVIVAACARSAWQEWIDRADNDCECSERGWRSLTYTLNEMSADEAMAYLVDGRPLARYSNGSMVCTHCARLP